MRSILVVVWITSLLAARIGSASILPVTFDQLDQHGNAVSGGGACVSTGSYDSDTFLWQQSHTCSEQRLRFDDGTSLLLQSERTTLAAFVDLDGKLLGGTFSWMARIPELGMSTSQLLGFGSVIDALYVDPDVQESSGLVGGDLLALVEMSFINDLLGDIGPLVHWHAYTSVFWPGCLEHFDGIPGSVCQPWSTPISYGGNDNWTGTDFTYLDRSALVPAPTSLALVFAALFLPLIKVLGVKVFPRLGRR